MTDKKLPKPKKKDRDWQEKIAKNLEKEKITLGHSQGFEHFRTVLKKINQEREK